jgi:predicted phage terminase large subunit-like protein
MAKDLSEESYRAIEKTLMIMGMPMNSQHRKVLWSISMELFGYYYFPHVITNKNNPFHKWIYSKTADFLRRPLGKGIKLAVAAPRGYAKSTLLSFVLPLWCATMQYKEFILLISETVGQAEDFLDDVKTELLTNDRLREDFPEACGKGEYRWRNDDIVLRNGTRIYALGCGGKTRGRKHRSKRPDLILLDDVESRDSVESETTRDKLWHQWLNKEVIKAGRIDGSTDTIVLGTILHEDSLLSKLLDRNQAPDWQRKRFKAVLRFADRQDLWEEWRSTYMMFDDDDKAAEEAWKFYKENEEEMLRGAKVLWPEGESYYDLMVMCLTPDGMSAFQSEKQNNPIDVTRMIVTKEDLQTFKLERYKGRGSTEFVIRLEEEEKEPASNLITTDELVYYGAWDPSKGKKARSGDYSAIVTIGKDKEGMIYVIDFDLKRRPVEVRMDDILELHRKFNYRLFVVETAAFQYFVKDALVKRARALDSDLRYKIREDTGQTDKQLRVEGLIPYISDGTLRFRHHSQWNMDYREGINQLVGFNAGAKYDDAPDALAMAFELIKHGVFRRKALVDGRTVVVGR